VVGNLGRRNKMGKVTDEQRYHLMYNFLIAINTDDILRYLVEEADVDIDKFREAEKKWKIHYNEIKTKLF
jgi:hypothetical protein